MGITAQSGVGITAQSGMGIMAQSGMGIIAQPCMGIIVKSGVGITAQSGGGRKYDRNGNTYLSAIVLSLTQYIIFVPFYALWTCTSKSVHCFTSLTMANTVGPCPSLFQVTVQAWGEKNFLRLLAKKKKKKKVICALQLPAAD
jgi:hypothetical protein